MVKLNNASLSPIFFTATAFNKNLFIYIRVVVMLDTLTVFHIMFNYPQTILKYDKVSAPTPRTFHACLLTF